MGVWDDHDYGTNDADKHFEHKEMMRELYLDFIDEPKDSTRRSNPDGIYQSYYLSHGRVLLILLDGRWNRDKSTGDDYGAA